MDENTCYSGEDHNVPQSIKVDMPSSMVPYSIIQPAPSNCKRCTILSIDGGGVRGIIPAIILAALERELQERDGEQARIADYFDIIAGTSTGGLITAMLTTPHPYDKKRPKYTAKEIVQFYRDKARDIFPENQRNNFFKKITGGLFGGPRYDGVELHKIIKEIVGENTRLSDTVTNVVIPTYDIKLMLPVIFSTYEVKDSPRKDESKNMDALLSDICIGTSAAPTYLPPHKFFNGDGPQGEFNLTDGGVAANNPALLATGDMAMQIIEKHFFDEIIPIGPREYGRFLVLSLGTGRPFIGSPKYDANEAASWGILSWLHNGVSTPLIDAFTGASADMIDVELSVAYKALKCEKNYLRIQDYTLTGDASSVDISTDKNMKELENTGNTLLQTIRSRMNLKTGQCENIYTNGILETNEEALKNFANELLEEQKNRKLYEDRKKEMELA